MARCIFHIDLDAFFASVEQVHNPELKGKPVVVGGDPNRRGVVSSASYEARPYGIHAGMPLSQARRFCPQAIFLQVNFNRYQQASVKFMKILTDFSPIIEPLGIDEAYLDVTEYQQPYHSHEQMASAIKERINKELNLTASVGISTCKVIAKIASDLCKPDGLLEIAPGKERDFLTPIPVSKLPGVGKKTEQVLKKMGITTIGELASCPLEEIRKTFGMSGIAMHRYANGIDDRLVELPSESKSINRQITFAHDTLDRHFLESSLRELCNELSDGLRSRNKQTGCIAIKLRYADFKTITRQVSLTEASNTTQVIFTTALQLLNKTLRERQKPIRLIGIKVSTLTGKEKQLPLFDPTELRTEKQRRLDNAIAQIRRKYSATSIKRGNDVPIKNL
jgi:DNA polymerase-4